MIVRKMALVALVVTGCSTRGGVFGNACEGGDQCSSGLCLDGRCTVECTDDCRCPEAYSCVPATGGVRVCVAGANRCPRDAGPPPPLVAGREVVCISDTSDTCGCFSRAGSGPDDVCSSASTGGSPCCADVGWPYDDRAGCQCGTPTCVQDGDGYCTCDWAPLLSGSDRIVSACTPGPGVPCCLANDGLSCRCGEYWDCWDNETPVSGCSPADVTTCPTPTRTSCAH